MSYKKVVMTFGAAYRALWNDKLNAEIDARIEKHRKADADGKTATKVIEVK